MKDLTMLPGDTLNLKVKLLTQIAENHQEQLNILKNTIKLLQKQINKVVK